MKNTVMIAVKTVFLVLNGCMIESKLSDITARGKKKKKLLQLHSQSPGFETTCFQQIPSFCGTWACHKGNRNPLSEWSRLPGY